jgi:hypothetical protein
MSIAANIKARYLKQKQVPAYKRTVVLKRPDAFLKVLLIINEANNDLIHKAGSVFPKAFINVLYLRTEKEDHSLERRYTVHAADFNLTGRLKNDKLNRLLETEFDLLIDLSEDSALLTYLFHRIKSTLVIGKLGHKHAAGYDLMFERTGPEVDFLDLIIKQLNQLIQK